MINGAVPIYKALCRPSLVMGCDRDLFGVVVIIAIGVGVSAFSMLSMVCAGIFYLVGYSALLYCAKIDPLLCKVFKRNLDYQKFYLASGSYWGIRPVLDQYWNRKEQQQ